MLNIFLAYAMSHLGTPYLWGGNNRLTGMDCSGFVMEMLKSVGEAPGKDLSADMLYDHYRVNGRASSGPGALVFYGTPDKATHVAISLGNGLVIEAGAGGPKTLNRGEAENRGACVRIRPINYRKDYLEAIMPSYPWGTV